MNIPNKQISSTNWEESYYGGYIKTLYDMPDVVGGDGILIRLGLTSKLGYYLGQKIVKIFLFKVHSHNLSIDLMYDSRIKDVDGIQEGKSIGRCLVLSPAALKKTFDEVCSREAELSNMFRHYEKVILGATIMFKLDQKNTNPIDLGKGEMLELSMDGSMIDETDFDSKSPLEVLIYNGEFNPEFKLLTPGKETIYSAEEKRCIHKLVQRLDISFDTDKDVVRSLKQGKIDTHKLVEIVAFNDRIYSRVLEDQKTKPFRVVILCDESGSMWHGAKIPMQHKLVKILYGALSSIMPLEHISIFGHTGDGSPEIYTYHDCFNPNFDRTIDQMLDREFCENYDGPVIEKIHQKIRSTTDSPILMIVISDGAPGGLNYGGAQAIKDLKRIIEKCKRDNFVIIGIGFDYDGVKDIYPYYTIVKHIPDVVEATTVLLNKIVKTEFK